MDRPKTIAPRERKWTIEAYNLTREVLLEEDGQIKLSDRRAGNPKEISRLPWHDLLTKRSIWDLGVESEILLYATRNLAPLHELDDRERLRADFWRVFEPARIEELRDRAAASEHGNEHALRTSPEGFYYKGPYDTEERRVRWDRVYFHGPVVGGTSQTFREKLREMLLEALEESASRPPIFPLLDYDLLPDKQWEEGDKEYGSRAYFAREHLVYVGWDNRGRPEGGRMDYSIEELFTGGITHVSAIPRGELEAILEVARIA